MIEKYRTKHVMRSVNLNDVPVEEAGTKEYSRICSQRHQVPSARLRQVEQQHASEDK